MTKDFEENEPHWFARQNLIKRKFHVCKLVLKGTCKVPLTQTRQFALLHEFDRKLLTVRNLGSLNRRLKEVQSPYISRSIPFSKFKNSSLLQNRIFQE